jgi:ATP-dependent Lhr-like helicase
LEQLQGFETAAAAWEGFLLSRRIADYDPEFLDQLCLSGDFVWARLTRPSALELTKSNARAVRPTRLAAVAFFRREQMGKFLALRSELADTHEGIQGLNLSHPAREVLEQLNQWGACFFNDLVRTTGRLPVEVEEGLWELVAAGLVTADGFDNLRALVDPKRRRGEGRQRSRRPRYALGRWTLLHLPEATARRSRQLEEDVPRAEVDLEPLSSQLLRRWGVVFRDLLARESLLPPWRDLLLVYRRLELQGRVRGGRFVAGFSGEQFALPEALHALRTLRKNQPTGESIRFSAADPLNLSGVLTPGPRVRPHPETILVYRDGVPAEEADQLTG